MKLCKRSSAGRLTREYPHDMQKHCSPETIYTALYVLPRGTLRSELLATLRQARKARRPLARGQDRRGQIPNMTSITERPAEVASRRVPGHWEGDWLKGARNGSAVGTLVERTTRRVLLAPHGWHGCRQCVSGLYEEAPACACPTAENADL